MRYFINLKMTRIFKLVLAFYMSFIIAIAPAYAILPAATALAGSTAARVAVSTATGIFVKKIAAPALKKLAVNTVGLCAKNIFMSALCTGVIGAMTSDGIEINVDNSDTNIDVDIYRKDQCVDYVFHKSDQYYQYPHANEYKSSVYQSFNAVVVPTYVSTKNDTYSNFSVTAVTPSDSQIETKLLTNAYIQVKITYTYTHKDYAGVSKTLTATSFVNAVRLPPELDNCSKKYLSDDEIYNYFTQNVSDDDITNIYNYDFSQHPNITVNNTTNTGDNVNKAKDETDPEEPPKKITEELAQKLKDKDVDIDEVNDDNCSKNANGEYDKCGADKGNDDGKCPTDYVMYNGSCVKKDDTQDCPSGQVKINGTCVKPDDDPPSDESQPVECKSNAFNQKICDFIDYVKKTPENDTTDNKVEIKRPTVDWQSIAEKAYITLPSNCPSAPLYSIPFLGSAVSFPIQFVCDGLAMLKPVVLIWASARAISIIGSTNI